MPPLTPGVAPSHAPPMKATLNAAVFQSWPMDAPPPADALDLLARLHAGELFVFRRPAPAERLALDVRQRLQAALCPDDDVEHVPRVPDPLPRLKRLRAVLGGSPFVRRTVVEVLGALGLPERTLVDDLRLRLVSQGAEDRPEAAPVYVMHRDTWYGCPQTQINAWIPLFDTGPEQAFSFFPRWFDRPVPNSSAQFDYATWMEQVGWHGETNVESYPQPTLPIDPGPAVRFGFAAGDVLLFSAAQLHQTQPNPVPGTTRYSVDFRFVLPGGPSAPNADNASRGAEERVRQSFRAIGAPD